MSCVRCVLRAIDIALRARCVPRGCARRVVGACRVPWVPRRVVPCYTMRTAIFAIARSRNHRQRVLRAARAVRCRCLRCRVVCAVRAPCHGHRASRAVRAVRAFFFCGIHIHRPSALPALRSHSSLRYNIWTVPALPYRVCGACCVPLTSRFARGACRAAVRAVRAVLWVRVVCRGCRVVPCRATPCAWPSSPWSPCKCGHEIIGNACCAPCAPCRVEALGPSMARPSPRQCGPVVIRAGGVQGGREAPGGPWRFSEASRGPQRPPEARRPPEASRRRVRWGWGRGGGI